MSDHNPIGFQQQFFNPASIQQQLNQQTLTNGIIRNSTQILQTVIPSHPRNNLNLQKDLDANEVKFFEQYKRIYNISYSLFEEKNRMQNQIKEALTRIQSMENKLSNLEGKAKQNKVVESVKKNEQSSDDNRNKRSRRTAQQIQKKFQCHAHQCQRYYGSQGSLQQHIKLKHSELLKKDEGDQDEEYEKSGDDDADHSMPA